MAASQAYPTNCSELLPMLSVCKYKFVKFVYVAVLCQQVNQSSRQFNTLFRL